MPPVVRLSSLGPMSLIVRVLSVSASYQLYLKIQVGKRPSPCAPRDSPHESVESIFY